MGKGSLNENQKKRKQSQARLRREMEGGMTTMEMDINEVRMHLAGIVQSDDSIRCTTMFLLFLDENATLFSKFC